MNWKLGPAASDWQPGQWVIYRKSKQSSAPGPRAASVQAHAKGDRYSYVVDKFWVVDEVKDDGELNLKTARGKTQSVNSDDPNLRKPTILERFLWRDRFQRVEARRDDS